MPVWLDFANIKSTKYQYPEMQVRVMIAYDVLVGRHSRIGGLFWYHAHTKYGVCTIVRKLYELSCTCVLIRSLKQHFCNPRSRTLFWSIVTCNLHLDTYCSLNELFILFIYLFILSKWFSSDPT